MHRLDQKSLNTPYRLAAPIRLGDEGLKCDRYRCRLIGSGGGGGGGGG